MKKKNRNPFGFMFISSFFLFLYFRQRARVLVLYSIFRLWQWENDTECCGIKTARNVIQFALVHVFVSCRIRTSTTAATTAARSSVLGAVVLARQYLLCPYQSAFLYNVIILYRHFFKKKHTHTRQSTYTHDTARWEPHKDFRFEKCVTSGRPTRVLSVWFRRCHRHLVHSKHGRGHDLLITNECLKRSSTEIHMSFIR